MSCEVTAKSQDIEGWGADYHKASGRSQTVGVAIPSGRNRPAKRPGSVTSGLGRATTRVPSRTPVHQAVTGRAEAVSHETTKAPVRHRVKRNAVAIDRLARSEARLLAVVLIVTALACGSLVFYLAAYAQVASLGIQQSAARVKLRQIRMDGEVLRAQCERAASPDIIRAAAANMGMTSSPTRIAYVEVGGQPLSLEAAAGTSTATSAPAQPTSTAFASAGSQTPDGVTHFDPASGPIEAANAGAANAAGVPYPRMASRGASTNTLTAESSAN
jgi:hypothetical protein